MSEEAFFDNYSILDELNSLQQAIWDAGKYRTPEAIG